MEHLGFVSANFSADLRRLFTRFPWRYRKVAIGHRWWGYPLIKSWPAMADLTRLRSWVTGWRNFRHTRYEFPNCQYESAIFGRNAILLWQECRLVMIYLLVVQQRVAPLLIKQPTTGKVTCASKESHKSGSRKPFFNRQYTMSLEGKHFDIEEQKRTLCNHSAGNMETTYIAPS